MTTRIPLVDLGPQQARVADEVREGWRCVLERSAFVQGDEVERFEHSYADFCGVAHCVGVGNGTDALELILRALGIGAGDEVIVPANSFVASAESIVRAGGTPVLVDVDPVFHLIDPNHAAERIGHRTRAIMPVHLYGQVASMESLTQLTNERLAIVEDAAQAQGAKRHGISAGRFGVAGATSFYPGKNLGAYGDAGAVLTSSDEVARKVRTLGNHGSALKYHHDELGFNSRLDSLQAVVLSAKLHYLDGWNESRREAAGRYRILLEGIEGVTPPDVLPDNDHVWHLYVIRVRDRDRVVAGLKESGIEAGIHYPIPIHLQGAFRYLGYGPGDFPVAESAAQEILSLPMYPGITSEQQERVVAALRKALR